MDHNCHFLTVPQMAELCSRGELHLPITACGGGGGSRGSSWHPRAPLCWWACRAWGFPLLPQMPPCCSFSGNRRAMARLSQLSAGTISLMPVPPEPSSLGLTCMREDSGVNRHLRWGEHFWPFQPRAFIIRFCSHMKACFFSLFFLPLYPWCPSGLKHQLRIWAVAELDLRTWSLFFPPTILQRLQLPHKRHATRGNGPCSFSPQHTQTPEQPDCGLLVFIMSKHWKCGVHFPEGACCVFILWK